MTTLRRKSIYIFLRFAIWILAFNIMMFAVILVVIWRVMPTTRILTRINANFSLNTGFINPQNLQKETWTTLKQTSYENGREKSQTIFKQNYFGYYTICNESANSTFTVLLGKSIGSSNWEYLGNKNENSLHWIYFTKKTEEDLCFHSYYRNDTNSRINLIGFISDNAYKNPGMTLNDLNIQYAGDKIEKQMKSDEFDEMSSYRTMIYNGDCLSKTIDYSADDILMGYTEYTYEGMSCTETSYNAENSLTGSTITRYHLFGNVKAREQYDAKGNLISREEYYYRFWEGMNSPYGWICVLFVLSLSVYITSQIPVVKFIKWLQ